MRRTGGGGSRRFRPGRDQPQPSHSFGEFGAVGHGRESELQAGRLRLGREAAPAGTDGDAVAAGRAGDRQLVLSRGEPDPQVQTAGTHDLRLGSSVLGVVFATASVGGLTGSLLSRRVIARFPLGRVYFTAQAALLLGPTVIVLAGGPGPAVVALDTLSFFTTYLGLGVANVIIVSPRQIVTTLPMMGRMTACFRMLLFGGGALGGLTAGMLAGAIGERNALAVAASFPAAVALVLAASPVTRLRSLPPGAG